MTNDEWGRTKADHRGSPWSYLYSSFVIRQLQECSVRRARQGAGADDGGAVERAVEMRVVLPGRVVAPGRGRAVEVDREQQVRARIGPVVAIGNLVDHRQGLGRMDESLVGEGGGHVLRRLRVILVARDK